MGEIADEIIDNYISGRWGFRYGGHGEVRGKQPKAQKTRERDNLLRNSVSRLALKLKQVDKDET